MKKAIICISLILSGAAVSGEQTSYFGLDANVLTLKVNKNGSGDQKVPYGIKPYIGLKANDMFSVEASYEAFSNSVFRKVKDGLNIKGEGIGATLVFENYLFPKICTHIFAGAGPLYLRVKSFENKNGSKVGSERKTSKIVTYATAGFRQELSDRLSGKVYVDWKDTHTLKILDNCQNCTNTFKHSFGLGGGLSYSF